MIDEETTIGHHRGHPIHYDGIKWIYSDNNKSVNEFKDRECGYCGKQNTSEGHDDCISTLPGLMNACCGHGNKKEAYVQFLDEHCVHGEDAITIQEILKQH